MSRQDRERGEHGDFFGRLEAAVPAISLIIAAISLIATIAQTFNHRKNIETVQQNVLRTENLKTCRDIIEVFFAFRLRAEETNAAAAAGSLDAAASQRARRDLKGLVYRFGAIGTHLANFTPEKARERYATLSWLLNDIAEKAPLVPIAEFEAKFAEADKAFASLNEDCAMAARFAP